MALTDHAVDIEDLRRMALRRAPRFVTTPIDGGAGDGSGNRRNIEAFARYPLLPRALVDVTPVQTQTTLFGRTYASPIGISAVGSAGLYRRHADHLLAEAARDANIPFILSGAGNASVEEIARLAPDHVWYQLYAARDPELSDHILRRTADAGVDVLVFTVDFPVPPRNEAMGRHGVSLIAGPALRRLPSIAWDALTHPRWAVPFLLGGRPQHGTWSPYAPPGASPQDVARFFYVNGVVNHTWREVERIRAVWKGRLVVKGLLHPDDARRAVSLGADAVTVSNHGGNRLHCIPASLDALRAVREAVGPATPVLFDGGIRRGSDVVIARALGATHCFTGRATLYGVMAGGAAGARRAVDILTSDLAYTMAMAGCKRVADIDSGCLAQTPSVRVAKEREEALC